MFKKDYISSFSFNNLGLSLDSLDYLRFKLKKLFFNNIRTIQYNKKILNWDKQKRFVYLKNKHWFKNTEDKISGLLYKPYKFNVFFKKLYNAKYFYYKKIYKKIFNNMNLIHKIKNFNIIQKKNIFKYHYRNQLKNIKLSNLLSYNKTVISSLNKKRFIKKYKFSLIKDLNFNTNSKNYYYYFFVNNKRNNSNNFNINNLYTMLNNNKLRNKNLYNFLILHNRNLPSIKQKKKINNSIYLLKNLIYNNNWLLNKKYFYYLTKKKLTTKLLKSLNYYMILYPCYIKLREAYNKLFW